MEAFHTVSNSMRAKDRDGNPKSWESQYGTFEVWNVYFQGDDIKYQVNKKPGFEGYQKGQQVYGTKTQGQYGGQFKQSQAPEGSSAPTTAAPAAQQVVSGNAARLEALEEEVRQLKVTVKNFLDANGHASDGTQGSSNSDADSQVDWDDIDIPE